MFTFMLLFEVSLLKTSTKVDALFVSNRLIDAGFFMDLIFGFFISYQDRKVK